jgi:ribosomal protein S12 methylthiotransferase accessory factor
MEAWEQTVWEGLTFPDPQGVLASAASLGRLGARPIDASRCARTRFSVWTADSPTFWTAGISLRDGEPCWVPAELVALPPAPDRPVSDFISGSNGLASGAHVLEALLSGLLEVVERDGLALASQSAARYDPTETLARVSPNLLDRIVSAGLVLEVIDATSDIGVPTYVALLGEPNGGPTGAFKGAGAALDPDVALVRAVTEAIQSRCVIVAGARDDVFETARAAAVRFAKPRTKPEIPLPQRTTQATGSILGDLERILTLLHDAGFDEVVTIRHTKASDPVQVVRVIVPGLEGYPFGNAAPGARALAIQGV